MNTSTTTKVSYADIDRLKRYAGLETDLIDTIEGLTRMLWFEWSEELVSRIGELNSTGSADDVATMFNGIKLDAKLGPQIWIRKTLDHFIPLSGLKHSKASDPNSAVGRAVDSLLPLISEIEEALCWSLDAEQTDVDLKEELRRAFR